MWIETRKRLTHCIGHEMAHEGDEEVNFNLHVGVSSVWDFNERMGLTMLSNGCSYGFWGSSHTVAFILSSHLRHERTRHWIVGLWIVGSVGVP